MDGVKAAMTTRNLETDQWRNREELRLVSGRRRQLLKKTGQIDRFSDVTPANFYQIIRRHIQGNSNFILKLFFNLLSVFEVDFSNNFFFPIKIL